MLTTEVSIVVLTRNGMATFPDLVNAIAMQADAAPRELVVVDSGSTDGTYEFARGVADRVLAISASEFNHGATRNLGIAEARGSLLVLLVQDARPVGRHWLSDLLAPLRDNARVAGSFARQVPRRDASAVVRQQLATWVAAGDTPRIVAFDPDGYRRQQPEQRLALCAFDNVCSAIRRSVWERIAFRPTSIAEDLEWSRDALLAGHQVAFAPSATVEHSHERGARYEFRRTWALHQQLYRLFHFRAIPTVGALARSVAVTLRAHHRLVREEGHHVGTTAWRRAMRLGVAWPAGQFVGGWTAAAGRHGWTPRGV